MSDIHAQANKIVTFFHRSPLQHATLRRYQKQIYGHEKSLLGSVITRWGSQYTMLHSVSRTYTALERWAEQEEAAKNESGVVKTILDPLFSKKLDWLLNILAPLHQAQKMSEAQGSNILLVAQRWTKLVTDIQRGAKRTQFEQEVSDYLSKGFEVRLRRQLTPLHWTAYYLLPDTVGEQLPDTARMSAQHIITRYCGEAGVKIFFEFRAKQGQFHAADLWTDLRPGIFWLKAVRSNRLNTLRFGPLLTYIDVKL